MRRIAGNGSAMHTCHLSVTISVEFADVITAQKVHYQPTTDPIIGVLLGQRCIFVVESVCTAAQFEKQVSDFNRLYQ